MPTIPVGGAPRGNRLRSRLSGTTAESRDQPVRYELAWPGVAWKLLALPALEGDGAQQEYANPVPASVDLAQRDLDVCVRAGFLKLRRSVPGVLRVIHRTASLRPYAVSVLAQHSCGHAPDTDSGRSWMSLLYAGLWLDDTSHPINRLRKASKKLAF